VVPPRLENFGEVQKKGGRRKWSKRVQVTKEYQAEKKVRVSGGKRTVLGLSTKKSKTTTNAPKRGVIHQKRGGVENTYFNCIF